MEVIEKDMRAYIIDKTQLGVGKGRGQANKNLTLYEGEER